MSEPQDKAAYVPAPNPQPDNLHGGFRRWDEGSAWECPHCFALTLDPVRHQEWHDEVESIARAARRGDMMTRRIG